MTGDLPAVILSPGYRFGLSQIICRNSNLKKKKNCTSGTSLIGENYYVYATETDQDKKRTFAYIGHATHPIKKLSIGVVRFN